MQPLIRNLGPITASWAKHPYRVAGLACAYYALLIVWSLIFGNAAADASNHIDPQHGFLERFNWGWLYGVAMPVVPIFFGKFLGRIDTAFAATDRIIKPVDPKGVAYSEWLGQWYERRLRRWLMPAALFIALLLTLAADWRDIFAPLVGVDWAYSSGPIDWSNFNPRATHERSVVGFAFNLFAFGMQVFLGFMGFALLAILFLALWILVERGLKGSNSLTGNEFIREWDLMDPTGRCGLAEFDKVFLFYVALIFLSLGAGLASVIANRTAPTFGSYLLLTVNMIILPVSFFWILVPYWTNFPRVATMPNQPAPRPWPFGEQAPTWALVVAAIVSWVYMAGIVFQILNLGKS